MLTASLLVWTLYKQFVKYTNTSTHTHTQFAVYIAKSRLEFKKIQIPQQTQLTSKIVQTVDCAMNRVFHLSPTPHVKQSIVDAKG